MPVRVAIIGSGPAGFYAADALLRAAEDVDVDIIERLPTPYGLIRAGVAPDHQTTKKIINKYEKTALMEQVRYFGNVELGREILANSDIDLITADTLAEAAEKAVAAAEAYQATLVG